MVLVYAVLNATAYSTALGYAVLLTFGIVIAKICQLALQAYWRLWLLNKNSYTWAGLGLLITGGLVSSLAYFVLSLIWLTALGICMLILSSILLALGNAIPKLPPEICSLLLETGIENMATIIEELGIRTKAIYLPSSMNGGRPKALIPLHANPVLPPVNHSLPRRFITRFGTNPDDIGLLFTTVGSSAVGLIKPILGSTPEEFELALTSLLSGTLGVADSVTVNYNGNHHIKVEIHNPRLENKTTRYQECLGDPLASIVASVTAEAWNRPVKITQEERNQGKYAIELEITE